MKKLISLLAMICAVGAMAGIQTGPQSSGGGSGSQTPLTNNVDGGGFTISNSTFSGTISPNSLAFTNKYQAISGAPERDFSLLTPDGVGQIALVQNGGATGLYSSLSTNLGDWRGNWLFNGIFQVGTRTNTSAANVGQIDLEGNGNGIYQNTNGSLGNENLLSIKNYDPKQAGYIAFSSPSSGSGSNNIVMSAIQDVQMGLAGWVYGTNTLLGLGIGNDFIPLALNPGHDAIWTTTENKGAFGAREFLSYDALNSVWYWPYDISGNGTFKNIGYQYTMKIDEKAQLVTFSGGATVVNQKLMSFGTVGDIWGNSTHSIEQELQLDSQGSFSATVGQDAQAKSVIQMGGSGHYHTPVIMQYDSSGLTNLLGWSTPLLFASENQAVTNGTLAPHYFAISGFTPDTNANHASVLKFWSSWAGGDFPVWNGGQNDPLGSVLAGTATSNSFSWNGTIIGTNGGVFGRTNVLSTDFSGTTFAAYDPSDLGATGASIGIAANLNFYGKVSSTSGQTTEHRFLDRTGAVIFDINPLQSKIYAMESFGVQKTSPTNTLDVNGGISTGTLVVSNTANVGALVIGAATNIASFTVVNTNWISGQIYTNTTGRPILVCGSVVLTTAGVAGYSQMALQCAGSATNYATVLSAVAGLTGVMTNAMTPLVVTNSGVFAWTNTSSGAGDTSGTWGGQYITY